MLQPLIHFLSCKFSLFSLFHHIQSKHSPFSSSKFGAKTCVSIVKKMQQTKKEIKNQYKIFRCLPLSVFIKQKYMNKAYVVPGL